MSQPSLYVLHHGCDALDAEMEELRGGLMATYGLAPAARSSASIIVLGGCTFTAQKEAELMETIDGLLTSPQLKLLVVSGCYLGSEHPDPRVAFTRRDGVSGVVGSVVERFRVRADAARHGAEGPFIRISEGCYGQCTFCSIRHVRGRHRSRPLAEIMSEVASAASVHETIRLVGQEVSAYGRDIGETFASLLRRLYCEFPDLRVEVGSLHPRWLMCLNDDELVVLAHPNMSGNVHIPLEAASDVVLTRMRRSYTVAEYEALWHRLNRLGARSLSTDIIAGFPGESEDDHKLNLKFVREHEIAFAQLFKFEPRPGTTAANMSQLDGQIRLYRAIDLIAEYVVTCGAGARCPLNTNVALGDECDHEGPARLLTRALERRGVAAFRAREVVRELARSKEIRAICESDDPAAIRSMRRQQSVQLTVRAS